MTFNAKARNVSRSPFLYERRPGEVAIIFIGRQGIDRKGIRVARGVRETGSLNDGRHWFLQPGSFRTPIHSQVDADRMRIAHLVRMILLTATMSVAGSSLFGQAIQSSGRVSAPQARVDSQPVRV